MSTRSHVGKKSGAIARHCWCVWWNTDARMLLLPTSLDRTRPHHHRHSCTRAGSWLWLPVGCRSRMNHMISERPRRSVAVDGRSAFHVCVCGLVMSWQESIKVTEKRGFSSLSVLLPGGKHLMSPWIFGFRVFQEREENQGEVCKGSLIDSNPVRTPRSNSVFLECIY